MNILKEIPSTIRDAYLYAAKLHRGHKIPFTDLDYIKYPEYVACLVGRYTDDETLVIAALLHKTVETNKASLEDLINLFGDRVANLVCEVTSYQDDRRSIGRAPYLLTKFNHMSSEALTIKLCSRLHNVYKLILPDIKIDYLIRYIEETYYILENLDRELEDTHEQLLEMILSTMFYVEVNKNL